MGGNSFVPGESNPGAPCRARGEEEEGGDHYQNRMYSVPPRTERGSGDGGNRLRNDTRKALCQLNTSSSLNRN